MIATAVQCDTHHLEYIEKNIFVCQNCDYAERISNGMKTPVKVDSKHVAQVKANRELLPYLYKVNIPQENQDKPNFATYAAYRRAAQFIEPLES